MKPRQVKGKIISTQKLSLTTRKRMFEILKQYYDGINWNQFQEDLSEKNDVILLENGEKRICGFSTLLWKKIESEGQNVIGVFSGDTVLEKEYWGSSALGKSFLKYLWLLKLKNIGTPVYWFLISKGYKTYLLMANNFKEAYPDFQVETPLFEKRLMDNFYKEKFGDNYLVNQGLIVPAKAETCKLKREIAPITDQLREKSPRVAFFEKCNPNWTSGTELACIAKMTLDMPLRYSIKKLFNQRARTPQPLLSNQNSKQVIQSG